MNVRLQALAAACGLALAAALPAHAASIVTGTQDFGTWPHRSGSATTIRSTTPTRHRGLRLAGVPETLLATDLFYDDYAFTVGGSSQPGRH